MRPALAALAVAMPVAYGHLVSISSGELRLEDRRATYQVRVPLYELSHMQDPSRALFEKIRFTGGGGPGRLLASRCAPDPAGDVWRCEATLEFPGPVEDLQVDCRFYQVTVPNHVHILKAYAGGKQDQAVFDASFPSAALRFRPPSPAALAAAALAGGAARALGGWPQIVFLLCLVLAGRTRRELLALAAAFVAGQVLAALTGPGLPWQPAPRFLEAAVSLTVGYLAVEMLLLPTAGHRWAVTGVLGLFHGLAVAAYQVSSQQSAPQVAAGAALATASVIAALGGLFWRFVRLPAGSLAMRGVAASLLLVGLAWFWRALRA